MYVSRGHLICMSFFFHVFYLKLIFDIYFTLPIEKGMKHYRSTEIPPAKRVFFIVGDGLRADKALKKIFNEETGEKVFLAPYLREIVKSRGSWGISHARIPTESRPGHISMLGGFYEDVSAVLKGWKTNPVDFDSVFNQSINTYSFGSPDILNIFKLKNDESQKKIVNYMYPSTMEDFTKSSILQDKFVFDTLINLFKNLTTDKELYQKLKSSGNIFFLHLLGCDTAGHAYRPYSNEYYDNIRYIDGEISKLVPFVESFFNDNQTAFIFTADHGMSDLGSHGDGNIDNTRTPFIAWGAGIKKPVEVNSTSKHEKYNEFKVNYESDYFDDWDLNKYLRNDFEQADISILISYLIGSNYPVNSLGRLPVDIIDSEYSKIANSFFQNSLVTLEHFKIKKQRVSLIQTKFKDFKPLSEGNLDILLSKINLNLQLLNQNKFENEFEKKKTFKNAIELINDLYNNSLNGINYLQFYNSFFLKIVVFFGFLGIIFFSIFSIIEFYFPKLHKKKRKLFTISNFITLVFGSLLFLKFYYQRSPIIYYIYVFFPLYFWNKIIENIIFLRSEYKGFLNKKSLIKISLTFCSFLLFYEIICYGFFYKKIFSLLIIVLSLYPFIFENKKINNSKKLNWCLTCLCLSIFFLLDLSRSESLTQINLGGSILIIMAIILKRKVNFNLNKEQKILFFFQILLLIVSLVSTNFSVFYLQTKNGLPRLFQYVNWSSLFLSLLILPSLHVFNLSKNYMARYLIVFLSVIPSFIILTVHFESLFLVFFLLILYQWSEMESLDKKKKNDPIISHLFKVTRISLISFFFLHVAFFGLGNFASFSSFTLDSVYRLVPIFSPFLMSFLLIFKIIVPYILHALCLGLIAKKLCLQKYILSILTIPSSVILSMNFFNLIKTNGSWMDIGITISNFCLSMFLSLLMLILEFFGMFFLRGVTN